MTPTEGSVEWWEAVARSHRAVIANPPRFKNPSFPLDDHQKAADEAERKADALRRYPVSEAVEESLKDAPTEPISLGSLEAKLIVTAQDWGEVFGG